MRIIGGSSKRQALKSPPPSLGVRPILARIKKSLFDIIRPWLEGADFLDLYAGSGSVGIEALSRGARFATFVDMNPNCLSIVRQNLTKLKLFDKARLVRADITKDLGYAGGPFDLIFMGPPYHDDRWTALSLTQPTLQEIARTNLLKEGGMVIGQHHTKEPPVDLPEWDMFREESYGDSKLSFFRKK
jgi:16S rRNA (guanine966-N2)-methyltransferase